MKRIFNVVDLSGRKDYPEEATKKLDGLKVNITHGNFRTQEEIIEGCKKADVLLVTATHVTRYLLNNLPCLKAVIRYGVGLDRIDLSAAREKGVVVCNVTGFCTEEVSEHVLAMMLNFARNIHGLQKTVRWGRWEYTGYPLHRLSYKTLGIVGLGEIGRTLARKAFALGMTVLGYDPYIKDKEIASVKITTLEDILKNSDYISLHCPLTEKTRHLIGEREFKMMKPGAFIINTARGGIIKESALIAALQKGLIGGVGLDVFESEPPSGNNPLLAMENVIITPHMAWYSEESSLEVVTRVFEQLSRVIKQLQKKEE